MKKTALSIALFAAVSTPAFAEVNISGFGQVVAGTSGDEIETIYNYDDKVDFTQESLFALQIDGEMTDGFSATVQLVARGAEDFDPEFAWAYITYDISDAFDLRAGRFRAPFYRYSDFLEVGYAYHWTRVPATVYDTLAVTTIDGVNLSHSTFVGDWYSRVQLVAGSRDADIGTEESPAPLKNDDILGVSWDLSYEWFSARAAYFRTTATLEFAEFAPVLDAIAASGYPDVADRIAFEEDAGTFLGFSLEGDWDNYFAGAEWVRREADESFLNDVRSWYVTGGTRIGPWTFHLTYAENDAQAQTEEISGLPVTSPLYPLTFGFLSSFASEYQSLNIGARWDVRSNVALKFDVEQRDYDLGGVDAEVATLGLVYSF
jgi:hypothetical protein